MYEYAITDGEGTLIDYGKCDVAEARGVFKLFGVCWEYGDLLIAYADDDCATGE